MYEGERLNSITHLAGAIFSIVALVVLVVYASFEGNPWKIVSFSIYGATLVLLYTSSTLYHSVRNSSLKIFFKQLDHLCIYLLIAGTYTPFTLVTLNGALGWTLFAVVWILAIAGIAQEFLLKSAKRTISIIIYLAMGWLIVVATKPLLSILPESGFMWLLTGGLFYSGGVVFYVFDKKVRHFHGIWHLFVLAGSFCHFITMFFYVK
ncbi:MAG: hemolysin III family protein [Sulfurospirillaceae bacterium]|nr:hemolysin III family protein [Sulfurospirillaceae bacterium]MDD3463337.1 hemolysin III family protein [Sulfurospirillaceae bacterium]